MSEYWCCVSLIAKLVMANRLHLEEQFGWEQCARQAPYCKLFKVTNNRARGLRIGPRLKSARRPPPSAQAKSANFRPFYVKKADFSPPPLATK